MLGPLGLRVHEFVTASGMIAADCKGDRINTGCQALPLTKKCEFYAVELHEQQTESARLSQRAN